MTVEEFKAWMDGFSEAVEHAPTPEQWKKIREKLDEVQPSFLKYDPAKPVTPSPYIPEFPSSIPGWAGYDPKTNYPYTTCESADDTVSGAFTV